MFILCLGKNYDLTILQIWLLEVLNCSCVLCAQVAQMRFLCAICVKYIIGDQLGGKDAATHRVNQCQKKWRRLTNSLLHREY